MVAPVVTPSAPAPVPVVPTNHPPAAAVAVVQPNIYTSTWIPLRRWVNQTGAGTMRYLSPSPSPTFALTTTNGGFVFHANSRVADWRGLEVLLGFAPQWIDGQLFLHALDLRKNVAPLLQPAGLPSKTNRIIVLDPGHGGSDAGTRSVLDRGWEKEYTLDWAFRLAELLATQGWQVFLTRTNDSDVSLSNRVAFAEAHRADVFLSLHFNSAAPDKTQSGLETYCLTPTGMPSNLLRTFEDDASLSFANNKFDTENLQLATRLHRELLEVNGHHDRGVRHARFLGVLRGQNRPAVLVEGGYLSNPHEARNIADPGYRQRLAEALADALKSNNSDGTIRLAEVQKKTESRMQAVALPPTPAARN